MVFPGPGFRSRHLTRRCPKPVGGSLDEIIANYETEIALEHEDFKKYLSENISYSIDDSMRKGLEIYFSLAEKNGLIEKSRKLIFIGD